MIFVGCRITTTRLVELARAVEVLGVVPRVLSAQPLPSSTEEWVLLDSTWSIVAVYSDGLCYAPPKEAGPQ